MARTTATKEKVTFSISSSLNKRLSFHSSKTNTAKSRILETALLNYLDDESEWDILFRRLNRNRNDYLNLDKKIGLFMAAFELFMRYFFALSPELPEVDKKSSHTRSNFLFAKYIERLKKNTLDTGKLAEVFTLKEYTEEI